MTRTSVATPQGCNSVVDNKRTQDISWSQQVLLVGQLTLIDLTSLGSYYFRLIC